LTESIWKRPLTYTNIWLIGLWVKWTRNDMWHRNRLVRRTRNLQSLVISKVCSVMWLH